MNHLGYIAQDIEQVIPKQWEGIVTTDNKGHKRLDYCKTAVHHTRSSSAFNRRI